MNGKAYFKYIVYFYLVILFLTAVLPMNGENSALNNNYTFSIRWDYLLHAIIYLPLPVLIRTQLTNLWLGLIIGLVIAAGFEALQMLVPYRAFNINDLVANGVGVMIGWIIVVIVRKKLTFA